MSKEHTTLTQERLKELLEYDPETGIFTRRVTRSPNAMKSTVAGTIKENGYRKITIEKKHYYEHRLAWFYINGRWPIELDHIDGKRNNNRITNLRECNRYENCQNNGLRSDSTSGLTGVSWANREQKWNAVIWKTGKRHNLGYFHSKDEAHAVYLKAKAELHSFQPTPREA